MGQNFHGWLQKGKFLDKRFVDAGLPCRMTTLLCLICGFYFANVKTTWKSAKNLSHENFPLYSSLLNKESAILELYKACLGKSAKFVPANSPCSMYAHPYYTIIYVCVLFICTTSVLYTYTHVPIHNNVSTYM